MEGRTTLIYLFDKDEKLVKIVKNTAIKTALQKFALTNEHYISDRLDIDMKALSDADLSKIEYVAIQSMEDSHTFHYFWIAQKQNKANLTTIVSVQSGIEELQKTTVKDIRPQNKEARPVLDELLLGTNWTARFVEGVDVASATFYYISTFEALKKVCEIWGLEMQFFVEMNGNKVGGRYIDFKKKIGVRSGKRVVYGHNALEILQEIERTNIYTALIGRGKGEQVSADGYGRKITFADVVWDSPVAKPKGQEYVELPSMTALYGIKNADGTMRPKIGFVEFQEETDPATLLKRTYNHLVNVARPQAAFKTSAVYLKGVKIGDTVRVVRHDKKIDYETRIFEITFNRLNNKASDIKLGDNIRGTDSQNQAIQTSISNAIESTITSFVTKLPDFLPSADGFNSNWYTDSDPTLLYPGKVLINDLWFKPDSDFPGEYVMLRWTGEAWEEVIRTSDSVKFEDALTEVNAAIKDGDDALNQKYDEIVAKTISQDTLISQAQSTADSAKADATTAMSNIASESQKLTEQINALSKTEGDHYTATNQTLTQLDGTVKGLQTDYTALVNKDNEITQTLTNYKQTIDKNTASITENKKATDGTISSLQTQVTQNKNDIATKASQLTVNNLSGRMSSAETTITQNANEISTRLSQTNIESLITSKATVITDNKVKETSESFSREITRVDGKIDGMSVGSVNYIVKSNKQFTDKGLAATGITNTVADGILHVEAVQGNSNYLRFDWAGRYPEYLTNAENKFNEDDDFTITFWCKRLSGDGIPNVFIKSGMGYYPLSGELNATEFKPISYTGKWKKANDIYLHLGFYNVVGVFEFEKFKLSKGNITTDWSPSPEDMVMLTSFNTVKDTVDSHTQMIGQQGTSLTATIQKVDSIQTSVSNIDGRLSTVTQTADGLVTTVQNLSVGGRNYLTKSNLIKDSGTNKLNALSIYDAETPNGFKVTGNSTKDGMVRLYNVINSDGWWTVSFDIKGSQSLAVDVTVDICDQGSTKIWTNTTNTYERKSVSVNVTNYSKNPSTYHFVDFSNFAFAYFWIDNIQIEKGNISTDWSPAPEDTDAKISAVQTTVTQTANSWAVKNLTSNGSILGQINLTDGTVKIDGKIVRITGQTIIDNAVIKSSMIESLTADKLTAGTIDANTIRVINLNANSLVGMDANFLTSRIGNAIVDLLQGKIITAQNGAMELNLNNAGLTFNQSAIITFNSSYNAIVRKKGAYTSFLHFNDDSNGGLYTGLGVTSTFDGINSQSSGRFAGIRIFRDAKSDGTVHDAIYDATEIYGDRIVMKDDFSISRGFLFKPEFMTSIVDMNYLVDTVRALARCWIHWNNVGWDVNSSALRQSIINEYNNYMKDL